MFNLEPDPANTGYGHGADEVAAVRPEAADVLVDYLQEVQRRTTAMLQGPGPMISIAWRTGAGTRP